MAGSEAGNLDAYFFLKRTGTLFFDSHQRLATFFSLFFLILVFLGTIGLKIRGKLQQCTTIGSARNLHWI